MITNAYYTIEGENVSEYEGLEEALNLDKIYDRFVGDKKIKMVGKYTFTDGSTWHSFPKYYKNTLNNLPTAIQLKQLDTICKVIEKLRQSGKNLFEGDYIFKGNKVNLEKKKVNIIELSRFLVDDYIQNGIFEKTKTRFYRSGKGKTAWHRTITTIIPTIDGENIIYDRSWRKREAKITNDIIPVLHAKIVCEAIEVYNKLIRQCRVSKPEYYTNYDLSDKQQFVPIINSEMLTTFSDRESYVLKAMLAWIDLSQNYKIAGCTNCFHNVWEWVNDSVFGNQNSKISNNPTYHFVNDQDENSNLVFVGKGEAIPDTIYFDKLHNDYVLYIYDAKYYVAELNVKNGEIYGYPANADIVKQVSYAKGIINSMEPIKDKLKTKNVFLLPELSSEILSVLGRKKNPDCLFEYIGYVEQADFDSMADNLMESISSGITIGNKRKKDRVELYMVYCSTLYDMYLSNRHYIPEVC